MKEHQEKICIYFIIDNALPLLLYVGETMQTAKQRWNGTHDCKDYAMNYVELHRKHDLEVRNAPCCVNSDLKSELRTVKMCSALYDTPSDYAVAYAYAIARVD
jgi:hypothetical protein